MNEYPLLEGIKSPSDVKQLDKAQLDALCAEIRAKLIKTVSHNGGHLASNLGAVELTVALHRCFDSPTDRLVFDVGHQCYAHKLLTGRLERFDTLRRRGGLSGFPRPDESEHDPFMTGHSSTSISAAYGLSQAKQLKGQGGYVVAVIGDGSLSGGLAYEALNNAGRSHDNLIVVLNDNKMSISKNVGAMSRYLAVIRSRPNYYRFKDATYNVLQHIPLLGRPLSRLIVKLKTALKSLLYNSTIFEDMGFVYLGPVDGHDIEKMSRLLEVAKTMRRPVIMHINTVKGKGYSFAEQVPSEFHGVSSFDVDTGERIASNGSFSSELGTLLCSFAQNDRRICALSAAMSDSTGLGGFRRQFKSRFYDVGIAEQHAVTFAAGLSAGGLIPVFAVYSTFLQRAYDQILHDAALQNLKLVLAIDRAGVVGEDGETHQGVFDVAFLNSIPNVTIYSPCTYKEMRYDMKRAVYNDTGVVAVRYPRGAQPEISDMYEITEAPFDVFGAEGAEITVVCYGREFAQVTQAARLLEDKGVFIRIIKLNRIRPIDINAVCTARSAQHIYFFEEGMRIGGVAEHFEVICRENGFTGSFSITAIDDKFVAHASVAQSLEALQLDAQGVYEIIAKDHIKD